LRAFPATPALQETLANLRLAMRETKIMCAVMLDTKVRTLWSRCGHAVDTLRGHGLAVHAPGVVD